MDLGVDGGEDEKDHEGAGDRLDASSERNKNLAHWFQLLEEPHDAEGPEHPQEDDRPAPRQPPQRHRNYRLRAARQEDRE